VLFDALIGTASGDSVNDRVANMSEKVRFLTI